MSQITLADVLVLEKHAKEQNKKDEAGAWQKTGRVFFSMSVWQFGNERPAAISVDLTPEQYNKLNSLIGQRCSLNVDMRLTDFGPKFSFISVAGTPSAQPSK